MLADIHQLRHVLCHVAGVPQQEGELEALAGLVFRGMLHALPASTRAWFSELRDRKLAILVEVAPAAA